MLTQAVGSGLDESGKSEYEVYRKMLTIRLLEEELQRLCYTGEASDLHFNKGQEAITVGACAALSPTDYIVTHHRTIAHSISKGVPMKELISELLGYSTGHNHGISGEMHIQDSRYRYMFAFQLVGTCVSVAAGVAWAVKYFQEEKDIVALFIGDASSGNAQFHEGMNIAAVQKVPLLILVENNGLAGNVRKEVYLPVNNVIDRGLAYGIQGTKVDGNKIEEVVKAVRIGAETVRRNSFPFMVEFDTTRLCWHKQGQRDARSAEEIAELTKRDPLLWTQKRLKISQEDRAKLTSEITQEIQDALSYARNSSKPILPKDL